MHVLFVIKSVQKNLAMKKNPTETNAGNRQVSTLMTPQPTEMFN